MTYKNYIKSLLIFIGIILISTLLITFLYHKDIININTINIFKKLILPISTIIISIIIFLRLVILKEIKIINIIIYILILLIITISSILGINKKRN